MSALRFTCIVCEGDGYNKREPDILDKIEGFDPRLTNCTNCGGRRWVYGTWEDIEEFGEPLDD